MLFAILRNSTFLSCGEEQHLGVESKCFRAVLLVLTHNPNGTVLLYSVTGVEYSSSGRCGYPFTRGGWLSRMFIHLENRLVVGGKTAKGD